jgi:hypothetical protein
VISWCLRALVAKEKKCHKATKPTKVHKAPCWDILLQL